MSELREKIRAYLLGQLYLQEDHATDMADAILSLMREEGVDLEGWRPIESAPKDGTEIITMRLGESDSYEIQHWFVIPQTEYVDIGDGLFRKEDRQPYASWSQNGHRATHWRPLPTPPAALLNALENANG